MLKGKEGMEMELAENLKKLRKAAGLTQEALAEKLQPPGRSSPRSQGSRNPPGTLPSEKGAGNCER